MYRCENKSRQRLAKNMKYIKYTHATGCCFGNRDIAGKNGCLSSSFLFAYGISEEDSISKYEKKLSAAKSSGYKTDSISTIQLIHPILAKIN